MNIAAVDLKQALKKLSPLKTELYRFSPLHGIEAQDADALVLVDLPVTWEPFAVNGKKLTQVVNRMSGQVSLDLEPDKLVVRSAKAKVELEVQKVKPFQVPEIPSRLAEFSLPEFKKNLQIASAGVSNIKSKGYGNCVHLASLPLSLEAESPDGYLLEGAGDGALVLTRVSRQEAVPFEFSLSLNLSAVAVVQLMDAPKVQIGESNNCVYASVPGVKVFANRPFLPYDNFGPVFALKSKAIFQIETEPFAAALRTVEPLLDSTDNTGITCKFNGNIVECISVNQGSTAQDEAPYEQLEPDPIFDPLETKLKLSAKHLTGFLSKAGETFKLHVCDPVVRLESAGVTVLTMPVGK